MIPVQPECLDGPDGCQGQIEFRQPLTSTGRSFARCDRHWQRRLDQQAETLRKYGTDPWDNPHDEVPPADFDPLDAGEAWNPDEY